MFEVLRLRLQLLKSSVYENHPFYPKNTTPGGIPDERYPALHLGIAIYRPSVVVLPTYAPASDSSMVRTNHSPWIIGFLPLDFLE